MRARPRVRRTGLFGLSRLGLFGRLGLASALLLCLSAVLLLAPRAAGAQGGERIHQFDVMVRVGADGVVEVLEEIDYDFGPNERRGIVREIPVRLWYDDEHDRLFPLEVVEVSASGGASAQFEVEDAGGGHTRIRIGDPDRTMTGRYTYTILYRVEGVLNGFPDEGHDEFYWNAIGQQAVPIERATVVVDAPGQVLDAVCFAGPEGSRLGCDMASFAAESVRFVQDGLAPYEALTVVVAFPHGITPPPAPILEERWSLLRAFTVSPETVAMTAGVGVLAFGLVARFLWVAGRDRRWQGSVVDAAFGGTGADAGDAQRVPLFEGGPYPVEYTPPEGLRPGEIGTLRDEVAHPLDVTATIVDLAVRGYLTMEEVEEEGLFKSKTDWRLERRKPSTGLLEYEALLLDGLFEDGDEVLLSDLKTKFVDRLKSVQEAMYQATVDQGWYHKSPKRTRGLWLAVGFLVLVGGIGLVVGAAAFTHWALVPLPVPIAGLALIGWHGVTPARTPKGTAMLRRVRGFERFITTAEVYRARFAEQASIFYDYLPYAIVFGATERWANAFQGLDDLPEPTWYTGTGGVRAFQVVAFSESMQSFSVSSAGTIAATPGGSGSSGFGGGGFSGGGGGGGSVGSW